MNHRVFQATLAACVLSASVSTQVPDPTEAPSFLNLRYAHFDPLVGEPEVPPALQSRGADQLWIVQFAGRPSEAGRAAVRDAGGQIHGYLPEHAYVVRMDAGATASVESLSSVRWVGRYHAAYRLDPELIAEQLSGLDVPARRYNIVVVDKHNDKPSLVAGLTGLGGFIDNTHEGGLLLTATLTSAQLLETARRDEVLWIDAWTPMEEDVNNARIQAGANYVESQRGYSGSGLNAHIYEGIDTGHPAFSGTVTNVLSSGASSGHGTNTAGIVFGDGTGNATFRGFAPDAGKFYTNYGSVSTSRWQVVNTLVNTHNVSHTTASWGGGRTFFYTSVSADTDDIIFDHDICWTQSQSNAGNQDSRPQAWAKNIFSIGGVRHQNNSNPLDDSWSGSGSTGPASDGRIKPTMAAYYDSIGTTSQGGGYTTGFGGTSGATPIIAGCNILAIDMFTDEISPGVGPFGNVLRNPGGSKHSNRPHFTTLKALQVANTRQYTYTNSSTDNRREHVGWGYPNLQTMWDKRARTFIIDETDVLSQGQASRWDITVVAGEPELRVVMHHAEPAGNPSAAKQVINNLSLQVTAPNGTTWWGNEGLERGNFSLTGGVEDDTNPIECVILQNPQAGVWHVDVMATLVVQDSHVETPAVDADYGLVVRGGTGQGGQPSVPGTFQEFGQGCAGSLQQVSYCAQSNGGGGNLVPFGGSDQVVGFDILTRSTTGGTVNVPARLYTTGAFGPGTTPIASTVLTVGPTPGFYTATFAAPVSVTSTFYIGMDSSAGTVLVSDVNLPGVAAVAYSRPTPLSGNWSVLVLRPGWRINCVGGTQSLVPDLQNAGLPKINDSYDVTLADALGSSLAISMTGFSNTTYNGAVLPAGLPDAPGCLVLVAPQVTQFMVTTPGGTANASFTVPNDAGLIGAELYHQWAVLDSVNTLGIVVSEGGIAIVGG